jgi:hypothetical protein
MKGARLEAENPFLRHQLGIALGVRPPRLPLPSSPPTDFF